MRGRSAPKKCGQWDDKNVIVAFFAILVWRPFNALVWNIQKRCSHPQQYEQ